MSSIKPKANRRIRRKMHGWMWTMMPIFGDDCFARGLCSMRRMQQIRLVRRCHSHRCYAYFMEIMLLNLVYIYWLANIIFCVRFDFINFAPFQYFQTLLYFELMPSFVEFYCADLTQSAFIAGRASDSDFRFMEGEIPTRKLNRLSKKHFQIVKDLSDINSPVFIEVNCVNIIRWELLFYS